MLTRATIRKNQDLYWELIATIYHEVHGLSSLEAGLQAGTLRRALDGTNNYHNNLAKEEGKRPRPRYVLPFSQICFHMAFEQRSIRHIYAEDKKRQDFYEPCDDYTPRKLWYEQNKHAIEPVVERIFGRERMAKRPDWLWS